VLRTRKGRPSGAPRHGTVLFARDVLVASPRTIKDVRTVLRSALHSAVRQELIDRNVAQLVQIPKQRKRKLVPWTSEEARRFLESARSSSDPLYTAYVLVLVIGLRKGEVLGLAWEAVNFDQSALVPDHQLQRVRRSLLYRETKIEASDVWLPMPDIVAAALTIRRAQQEWAREAAGEIWQQTKDMPSLIFTGRYGTPVDPRTLNRKFTARCEAAGVRPITVHDARHTCATLLVDLEVHPRVIMRILRHADQAITMEIYMQMPVRRPRARRCGDLERPCTEDRCCTLLLYSQLEGSDPESEYVSDQAFYWSG
jgi:integrase